MRASLGTALLVATVATLATPAALVRAGEPRERCVGEAYRGRAIDVDFAGVDLREALRTIARIVDLDLVLADDVKGQVTLRVNDLPWDQVLCAIAKLHRLRVVVQDGIWLVTPRP